MAHLGIISPPVSGHLHPFGALGRTLIKRGHRVTLFQMPDIESKARAEGLNFYVLGQSSHPLGSLAKDLTHLTQLKALPALRFTVQLIERTTEMICRDLPDALSKAGVDLLLVDQTEPAGAVVANHLKIPFVTVCNAMAINRESTVPPIFTGWAYSSSFCARIRNELGYKVWDFMMRPIARVLKRYAKQWQLPCYQDHEAYYSTLAQLSQQPAAFDFPRQKLPACFHYLGPFRENASKEIGFPWAKLDGRPVIYASLGTLQNRTPLLLRWIAEACEGLPAQLVISHGGDLAVATTLPGSPLVVSYAPQQALLAKGKLAISHAGLNTVLDSMSQGVPVVAVPLTYEQPAIAARLRWTGAGHVIPLARFSASVLRQAIQRVLGTESYYTSARRVADSIRQAGGVEHAADIIEEIMRTGKPVVHVEGEPHALTAAR